MKIQMKNKIIFTGAVFLAIYAFNIYFLLPNKFSKAELVSTDGSSDIVRSSITNTNTINLKCFPLEKLPGCIYPTLVSEKGTYNRSSGVWTFSSAASGGVRGSGSSSFTYNENTSEFKANDDPPEKVSYSAIFSNEVSNLSHALNSDGYNGSITLPGNVNDSLSRTLVRDTKFQLLLTSKSGSTYRLKLSVNGSALRPMTGQDDTCWPDGTAANGVCTRELRCDEMTVAGKKSYAGSAGCTIEIKVRGDATIDVTPKAEASFYISRPSIVSATQLSSGKSATSGNPLAIQSTQSASGLPSGMAYVGDSLTIMSTGLDVGESGTMLQLRDVSDNSKVYYTQGSSSGPSLLTVLLSNEIPSGKY